MFSIPASILIPHLQSNATIDPVGAVLEKYGVAGFAIVILVLMARYIIIQQTRQTEDGRKQEELTKQRQDQREKDDDVHRREVQDRYDKLQNEVRLQLSEQTISARQREMALMDELKGHAKQVADLELQVAVLVQKGANYDDRIELLTLKLQLKQSDFDAAAKERHDLETQLSQLRSELSVLNQAYQSLREQHDKLVKDQNSIKSDVVEMRRDTQTLAAVVPEPNTLPVSGTVTLLEAEPAL